MLIRTALFVISIFLVTSAQASPQSPRVYTKQGKYMVGSHELTLWELDSTSDKDQGLFGYKDLPADTGAVFIYDKSVTYAYTMVGMLMSLDIAFFDSDGLLVDVQEVNGGTSGIRPTSGAAYRYVVETQKGLFRAHGIKPGAVLYDLSAVPGECRTILKGSVSPLASGDTIPFLFDKATGFSLAQRAQIDCSALLARWVVASKDWQQSVAARKYCITDDRNTAGPFEGVAVLSSLKAAANKTSGVPVTFIAGGGNRRWGKNANAERDGSRLEIRRYYLNETRANLDCVVATIVHEWLHYMEFDDPYGNQTKVAIACGQAVAGSDFNYKKQWYSLSVVYGTETFTRDAVEQIFAALANRATTTTTKPVCP